MLAHELRNPLAPIRTAVQLLRLKELPRRSSARARDIIERQVEHLVSLIDDLLDVSRITRGHDHAAARAGAASAIVARAIETARPAIDARRHELVLDLPDELLTVEGDRTRLVQVVGNILHNATKFMAPGGRIVAARGARGRDRPCSRSRTTASASPPSICRVFDLFTQVAWRRTTGPGRARHRAGARPAARRDARRHRGGAQRGHGPRHRVRRLPAADDRGGAADEAEPGCRSWTPRRCRRTLAAASSSPTTTATPPARWRCGSSWPATRSAPPRTASRRWPSPDLPAGGRRCSISGCRRWTATRRRGTCAG